MPPLVFFSRRLRAAKASLPTIRAQSCVADEKQLAVGERVHPARVGRSLCRPDLLFPLVGASAPLGHGRATREATRNKAAFLLSQVPLACSSPSSKTPKSGATPGGDPARALTIATIGGGRRARYAPHP